MSAETDNTTSDADLLRRSAFFDPAYYLARYPDVAASAVDPISHYLEYGAKEGRDPSPDFSTSGYLQLYPDVAEQGLNPLVHFLRCGLGEGRDVGIDIPEPPVGPSAAPSIAPAGDEDHDLVLKSELFDPEYYLARYPDVAAAGLDPLGHYLSSGVKEGRDPSEFFSTSGYLQRHQDVAALGLNPLLHYLRHGQPEGRAIVRAAPLVPTLADLCEQHRPAMASISVFNRPDTRPRLNVVTDSVGPSSLFGGVATALILGTQLANRMGAILRLITLSEPPDARVLNDVLSPNELKLDGPFETIHMPRDSVMSFPFGAEDIFLTTSWWSTHAVLRAIEVTKVIYLLQEDERMFYGYGDQRLLCSETLEHHELTTVVNTQLLYTHLTTGEQAIRGLSTRALWFEPAFVGGSEAVVNEGARKRRLLFYSRPKNLRNLFWRGSEAICQAIERGVLEPDAWEFYFVGKDTPKFSLPRGATSHVVEGMNWSQYQRFVGTMDAALVLMDTPHPSYPPLDMAASGVAVLTNRHGIKTDLSAYSKNIIMADLAVPSLLEGLGELALLANQPELRNSNRASDGICRSWAATLSGVVDQLAERFAPTEPPHVC